MLDPNKIVVALAASVVGHVMGMICVTCIPAENFTKNNKAPTILSVSTNDIDESVGGEFFDNEVSQPPSPFVEMVVFGQPERTPGFPRPAKLDLSKTNTTTSATTKLDGTVHFVSIQSETPGFLQRRTQSSRSWRHSPRTVFTNPKIQRTSLESFSPSVAPVKTSGLIAVKGIDPPRIWRSYPPEEKTTKPETTSSIPTIFIGHRLAKEVASDAPPVTPPQALPGNPLPRFPNFDRFQGRSGGCELRVVVDARGNVSRVYVSTTSGNASLDAAAIAAVSHWRYRPATQGGNFVAGEVIERILFFVK